MPYQQPLFVSFALIYCLALGIFSLYQDSHSWLNRCFAGFNFCNAIWNAGDYAVFAPDHPSALFVLRATGIAGPMIIPFVMEFMYGLTGAIERPALKKILRAIWILGPIFSLLHFTPWIIQDVAITPFQSTNVRQTPGPLYPLFGAYMLAGLVLTFLPLRQQIKITRGHQKNQILYCCLACFFGALGLIAFFFSFFSHNYPWLYYPLQTLVSSIFAYAIFKHNLLPIGVAIRRALLLLSIYLILGMLLVPISYFYMRHLLPLGPHSIPALIFLFIVMGLLLSIGPFIYAVMVRRSALFQDRAASHVIHEFKTPLHAIQSAKEILDLELAKPRPDAARVRDYMDMIQRNADRLEGFVSRILTTVKAGETRPELAREPLDLAALAQDVVRQFPGLADRLKTELDTPVTVRGDAEALREVLTNLLFNAAKFCPRGRIAVRVRKTSNGVECMVEDAGAGIARGDLERIFQPFVQSEGGKRLAKGTGLGLAIAQRWVEAHGGKIWAESDGVGNGSRFLFFLPSR